MYAHHDCMIWMQSVGNTDSESEEAFSLIVVCVCVAKFYTTATLHNED